MEVVAQARRWQSPNAGSVMAAGAGALNIQLGGEAMYHGKLVNRPLLGMGDEPTVSAIERAISLVQRAVLLWMSIIIIGGWLLA